MIEKVAEWGFPVEKFELKLMVKDMLTKKGNYNQKKFRKAKVQFIKKYIYTSSRHLLTQSQQ